MKPLFLCGIALVLAAPLSAQDRTRSPHGSLDLACETCHRSDGWTPPKISRAFDHGREGFPLLGAHKTASCRSCHESLDFTGAPTTSIWIALGGTLFAQRALARISLA